MLARGAVEPRRPDDAAVLEVPLSPAPVAHRDVDERGRALLVGTRQGRAHGHAPARAPDQGRLDEVVGEDVAAEGRLAGEIRQAAAFGEGPGADDGVVAPVIPVGAGPGREPRGDHRPVDAGGELLDAGEQGVAVDDEGQRLDDAGIRVRLHGGGERHDAGAGHQAVGVEHQHVVVGPAPAAHEVADIAGLAMVVLRPVAVVEARVRPEPFAQAEIGALLGDPGIALSRIREHEPVERGAVAGGLDLGAHGLDAREGAGGGLVVDRHHHGRAGGQALGTGLRAAPAQQHAEAQDGAAEGQRDPGEVEGEKHEQHVLQGGRTARHRDDLVHLPGAVGREQGRRPEHEGAGREGAALGDQRTMAVLAVPALQALHRHRQGRFRRHRRREVGPGGRRERGGQGVQRYSHVSVTGRSSRRRRRRNSHALAPAGSSSKATRTVRRSG